MSKTFLKVYLPLLFIVFSLSCEDPSPTRDLPSPPQPHGGDILLRSTCEVSHADISASVQSQEKIIPQNEPLFHKQWYLCNTHGIDINIVPVWRQGYGTKPISVGILDEAIDIKHPDLTDSTVIEEFSSYNSKKSHGTKVAGLLAARDNGVGIIGVVPKAKIYSYGLNSDKIKEKTIDVIKILKRSEHTTIAVYNASFGSAIHYYKVLPSSVEKAFDTITHNGFYGKGSSLVFAAGNDGNFVYWISRSSSSNDYFLNHHAVIVVNSLPKNGIVSQYDLGSTKGVNIWITAPSGRRSCTNDSHKMITTDNEGKYRSFSNTSAAAPLVSGAVALLRSEYPDLTWRDIKLILAESAKKHDEGEVQYRKSGKKYSDGSTQQHDHRMGFGLLDVAKAFDLAENWRLLPPLKTHTAKQQNPFPITSHEEHTNTLKIGASDIEFIESVTLEMNIEAIKKSESIQIRTLKLSAPDRKTSFIFNDPEYYEPSKFPAKITLVVNSFLGSSADGNWTLTIRQFKNNTIKKITDWSLTFRGH